MEKPSMRMASQGEPVGCNDAAALTTAAARVGTVR